MMSEYDGLVTRLREYAGGGGMPTDVVRWLHGELVRIQAEDFSAFTFTYCLKRAFGLDLETAQRVQAWAWLGWGGAMSDEELNRLLGDRIIHL